MLRIGSKYRLNIKWSTNRIDLLHSRDTIQQKQKLKKRGKNEETANFSSRHSTTDFFTVFSINYDRLGDGVSKTT